MAMRGGGIRTLPRAGVLPSNYQLRLSPFEAKRVNEWAGRSFMYVVHIRSPAGFPTARMLINI